MTQLVSEDRAFDSLEGGRFSSVDHIADPGPLGLSAFATTTFVLSCVNAGLAPKAVGR
jgi:succinate-acetate transporter protein